MKLNFDGKHFKRFEFELRMKRLWKWVRHYADKEQNYTYRFIGSHRV